MPRSLGATTFAAVCVAVPSLAACRSAGSVPRYLGSEAEYFTPSARIYFDKGKDDEDEIDLYKDGSISPAVDFLAIDWPFLIRQSTLSESKEAELLEQRKELQEMTAARKQADAAVAAQRSNVDVSKSHEFGLGATAAAVEKESAKASRIEQEAHLLEVQDESERAKHEEKEQAAKVAEMEQDVERANKARLDGDWIAGPRISIGITSPASDAEEGSEKASGAPVLYLGIGGYIDFFKGDRKPNSNDGVGVRLEAGYVWGVTADENVANNDDSALYVGMTVFLD